MPEPAGERLARQAVALRAAMPRWAVWYDPWLRVWVAVRGRTAIAVATRPADLPARAAAAWAAAITAPGGAHH